MPGRIHSVVASLVIDGLRSTAPHVLEGADLRAIRDGGEEGVALEPYREILRVAYAHDGGRALLQAGAKLRSLSHPLLFVLLNSDSPAMLIEKEARLAAFIHSRHRVVIESETETSLTLLHASEAESLPEPAEDLAACGQHIALLEEIGCRGLRCRFPASAAPELWVYEDGDYVSPPPGGGYQRWLFAWTSYAPTRKPMPGLDNLLLDVDAQRELSESPGLAAVVERVVRRDLGRTWRISEVADAVGMSPRSLQRALAGVSERYSDLLDRIRNEEAARLLRESHLSVTEIGYICGFADTAHFSRSFKKRFGAPPSEFRRG